jgi:hypothetical protein
MALTESAPIVVRDGGVSALRTVDFLAVGGLLPVQGSMEERAAGFAGRACCATKKELELRRTLM